MTDYEFLEVVKELKRETRNIQSMYKANGGEYFDEITGYTYLMYELDTIKFINLNDILDYLETTINKIDRKIMYYELEIRAGIEVQENKIRQKRSWGKISAYRFAVSELVKICYKYGFDC